MRPYGLPRNDDVAHPDKADQLTYGLKGTKMKGRKAARRVWKKKARQKAKVDPKQI